MIALKGRPPARAVLQDGVEPELRHVLEGGELIARRFAQAFEEVERRPGGGEPG